MPVGRPTKYRKEMCDQVPALMAQGMSLCELSAELGITRETLDQWRKSKRRFSDAVKKGLELSQCWWERQGRLNLENREFQYPGWYMNMKNRFGWADKQETKHTGDLKVTIIDSFPEDDG